MQQLTKILTLALLVFFTACKKDDDTASGGGDDLVRTWKVVEVSCTDGKTTTTDGTDVISATYTFTGKNITSTVVFKDDKTFSSTGSYTQVLKTTVQGQTFTSEITLNDFASTGTWSKQGNTLTLKNNANETQNGEIVELSSSKLRLKYLLNSTETDGAGTIVTQKATINYVLEPK